MKNDKFYGIIWTWYDKKIRDKNLLIEIWINMYIWFPNRDLAVSFDIKASFCNFQSVFFLDWRFYDRVAFGEIAPLNFIA